MLSARPAMSDERFARAVIYVCAHSNEGAMGIIVNQPAGNIKFPDLLVQLEVIPAAERIELPMRAEDVKVLKGGPVETGPPWSTWTSSGRTGNSMRSAAGITSSCTSRSGNLMLPAGWLTMMPMAPSLECAQT